MKIPTVESVIVIPECPLTLKLNTGGSIHVMSLDEETIELIIDAWSEQFRANHRNTEQ
jgi:hypothetical protein